MPAERAAVPRFALDGKWKRPQTGSGVGAVSLLIERHGRSWRPLSLCANGAVAVRCNKYRQFGAFARSKSPALPENHISAEFPRVVDSGRPRSEALQHALPSGEAVDAPEWFVRQEGAAFGSAPTCMWQSLERPPESPLGSGFLR